MLALVTDALALVRLRRADLADTRGDLADGLLGGPAHGDARGLRHFELDAGRGLDRHGMRVAHRQLEVLALECCAVADALDLEALLEAVGHALDHVRHERAGEAVQRAMVAAVRRTRDRDLAVILLDLHVARDALLKLTLRALHAHELRLDRELHARGDRDRLFANTRHRATRPARPARRQTRCGARRDRSLVREKWRRLPCPCHRGRAGRP